MVSSSASLRNEQIGSNRRLPLSCRQPLRGPTLSPTWLTGYGASTFATSDDLLQHKSRACAKFQFEPSTMHNRLRLRGGPPGSTCVRKATTFNSGFKIEGARHRTGPIRKQRMQSNFYDTPLCPHMHFTKRDCLLAPSGYRWSRCNRTGTTTGQDFGCPGVPMTK